MAKKFKEEKTKENEVRKLLYPFKKKEPERWISIVVIILGFLLMVSSPSLKISSLSINGFIVGVLFAFVGFIYFLDSQ